MILTIILTLAVIFGVCLMIYTSVALIQDKKLFSSAPKDIQEAILPKKERFKGAHTLGWILAVIALLILPTVIIIGAWDGIRQGYTFLDFFIRYLVILYGYKAFDMIFLDYFLLTKSHFYQHFFPETEGCKGFDSYGFNRKSQITRIVIYPVASVLTALVCTLF